MLTSENNSTNMEYMDKNLHDTSIEYPEAHSPEPLE